MVCTFVRVEAKQATYLEIYDFGSINQFCSRKKSFLKLKLTLSAPKSVKIEFFYPFFLYMIHNGILSVFFVEFISFDVRITFISIMTSDVRTIAIIFKISLVD